MLALGLAERLQAVEEFSELGQGFNIALRDLDIRGAGAMLGAEQSGFMEEIGYETYHKILDEAMQEIRAEEFSGLFKERDHLPAVESIVEVEADALLPIYYVSDTLMRLNLYRRISECRDQDQLDALKKEMVDRFGALPKEAKNLFLAAEMKLQAQHLRLPRLQFKNKRLFLSFPTTVEGSF